MTRSEVTQWLLSLKTDEFAALMQLLGEPYALRSAGGPSMKGGCPVDAGDRVEVGSALGATC